MTSMGHVAAGRRQAEYGVDGGGVRFLLYGAALNRGRLMLFTLVQS
jgi:hypothetical protein